MCSLAKRWPEKISYFQVLKISVVFVIKTFDRLLLSVCNFLLVPIEWQAMLA